MKRNNKALYEQIIWNVSREVKRALNEAEDNTSKTMYACSDILCTLTEDDYKNGEDPNTTEQWTEKNFYHNGSSIKEIIDRVATMYNCKDSICIYDDYVLMNTITNNYGERLSDSDLQKWKKGQIKGYSLEVRFNIFKQTTVTHDELVANGYESYD